MIVGLEISVRGDAGVMIAPVVIEIGSRVGPASPVAHSPTVAPLAASSLAATIASRRVQSPSSAVVSELAVTSI